MSSPILSSDAAQDAPTQHNRQASPLLRLPAELRNQIYTYAFGPYDILVDKLESNDEERVLFFEIPQNFTVRQSVNLTQVCRQIYTETNLLYWESKMLRFGPPSEDDSSIRNLLKALSWEKCIVIRHIAVHKEEAKLAALWEQLPKLLGLKSVTLWGCYFTWGTEDALADQLSRIQEDVSSSVGHHVEVSLEIEENGENE